MDIGLDRAVPLLSPTALLGDALTDGQPVREEDLVGGGPQVGAQMAAGGIPQDRAKQVLDRRRDLARPGAVVARHGEAAAPQLALQRQAAVDDRLDLVAMLRLGAQSPRPASRG